MRILIVKLSSLGDVVHAMPAVQDILRSFPQAEIDWVVERGFAPLVRRCDGVRRVIEVNLRQWSKTPLSAGTRGQWRAFKEQLRQDTYDAIIDLQGLTKSALVARLARVAPGGRRYAMANQTEGSSYEVPTRWVADVAIALDPHVHAVRRSRLICARALGYEVSGSDRFGLQRRLIDRQDDSAKAAYSFQRRPRVALVHGTSRSDKQWPHRNWVDLAKLFDAAGYDLVLPHGTDDEERCCVLIARECPNASVWPRMPLDALIDELGTCAGVIGVDSGLSHIAVALDLAHVQLYNFDTAWRTGPAPHDPQRVARQVSVYGQPSPTVDGVWAAWLGLVRQ